MGPLCHLSILGPRIAFFVPVNLLVHGCLHCCFPFWIHPPAILSWFLLSFHKRVLFVICFYTSLGMTLIPHVGSKPGPACKTSVQTTMSYMNVRHQSEPESLSWWFFRSSVFIYHLITISLLDCGIQFTIKQNIYVYIYSCKL